MIHSLAMPILYLGLYTLLLAVVIVAIARRQYRRAVPKQRPGPTTGPAARANKYVNLHIN